VLARVLNGDLNPPYIGKGHSNWTYLFSSLERSMREIDYKYNQFENGKMAFRMMLPPEREKSNFKAAADGQMVGIIKTYRDWKICGDTHWLRRLWPKVKKAKEGYIIEAPSLNIYLNFTRTLENK